MPRWPSPAIKVKESIVQYSVVMDNFLFLKMNTHLIVVNFFATLLDYTKNPNSFANTPQQMANCSFQSVICFSELEKL